MDSESGSLSPSSSGVVLGKSYSIDSQTQFPSSGVSGGSSGLDGSSGFPVVGGSTGVSGPGASPGLLGSPVLPGPGFGRIGGTHVPGGQSAGGSGTGIIEPTIPTAGGRTPTTAGPAAPKTISHELSSSESLLLSGGPSTVTGESVEVGTATSLVQVPAMNVTVDAVEGMIGLASVFEMVR